MSLAARCAVPHTLKSNIRLVGKGRFTDSVHGPIAGGKNADVDGGSQSGMRHWGCRIARVTCKLLESYAWRVRRFWRLEALQTQAIGQPQPAVPCPKAGPVLRCCGLHASGDRTWRRMACQETVQLASERLAILWGVRCRSAGIDARAAELVHHLAHR